MILSIAAAVVLWALWLRGLFEAQRLERERDLAEAENVALTIQVMNYRHVNGHLSGTVAALTAELGRVRGDLVEAQEALRKL